MKVLLISIKAVFCMMLSSCVLQGAQPRDIRHHFDDAKYQLTWNGGYDAALVKDICFKAQELCATGVSEYHIQIDCAGYASTDCTASISVERVGGRIITGHVPCGWPNYCSPKRKIIYQDELVKVFRSDSPMRKHEYLIVSAEHITNTHALDSQNNDHVALLNRIASVARGMSAYLIGDDTSYSLTIKNGSLQDPFHLCA